MDLTVSCAASWTPARFACFCCRASVDADFLAEHADVAILLDLLTDGRNLRPLLRNLLAVARMDRQLTLEFYCCL